MFGYKVCLFYNDKDEKIDACQLCRLVDSTPLLRVTSTSKKLTFSFYQSAVNLIFG